MSMSSLQKQTNSNIQDKANLIWECATHLVGLFKPHEYGKVILPMTVLKRFDDALKDTKEAVVKMAAKLDSQKIDGAAREGILCKTSGYAFYNTSKFDFAKLQADAANIDSNFEDYLKGFSANVKDILENFKFADQVKTMIKGGVLYAIIDDFCSKKADMSPQKITSTDMGYIFEELIKKFSESYDEQAGAHFTSRDIIYLMTELLVSPEKEEIKKKGCTKTAYDMAMGTSQMLGCLDECLKGISKDATLTSFGQEFNPETYAIAKADMLIKGGNANGMMYGDTLSDDKFEGYQFDYIISNPPFGIDWKREKKEVEDEAKKGWEGRFGPGLPTIGDGQLLFMLNGISKLKDTGTMTIIQNGSPLYFGEPDSGTSNIRKYILDNDFLTAIVRLPSDLFYNTPLITYIWVIQKNKSTNRKGKIQLIDGLKCYTKRRRPIGKKKKDLTPEAIDLIKQVYNDFQTKIYKKNDLEVNSIICDVDEFKYKKVCIFTPELDENNNPIKIKGKYKANKDSKIEEKFAYSDDPDLFISQNPNLYEKYAFSDSSKMKIGYEIPFTRMFFEFDKKPYAKGIFEKIKNTLICDRELTELSDDIGKLQKEFETLKDSNIDWIGKIPENWEINPISYYFTERSEKCNEQDFPPLSVTKKGIVPQLEFVAKSEAEGDSRKKVCKGDFVINSRSDRRQSCGVSNYDGSVSLINIVLKPKDNIFPEYAHFVMKNTGFADELFRWGHGIAWDVWTTTFIDMKKIMIPVPPIDIQKKICTYLKKLNELVEARENELNVLKDFVSGITYELISSEE